METETKVETPVETETRVETPVETESTEEVTLPSDEPQEQLIAGKFKSQEDLINAYKALESKLGQPKTEETTTEETKTEPEVDEEYEAYKQEKYQRKLLESVGGYDTYNQALEWARNNMTEQEIKDYNDAMNGALGNEAALKLIAKGLVDSYKNRSVSTGPIHSGETTKVTRTVGYETESDMIKDMSDPRYHRDPSFRDKVTAKLAVTDESKWYKSVPRGG